MKATDDIKSKISQGTLTGKEIDPVLLQLRDVLINKKAGYESISEKDFEALLFYRNVLDKLLDIEEGHINFSVKECQKYNLNFLKIKKLLEEPEKNSYIKKLHQAAFGGFIVMEVIDKSKFKEFLYRNIENSLSILKQE